MAYAWNHPVVCAFQQGCRSRKNNVVGIGIPTQELLVRSGWPLLPLLLFKLSQPSASDHHLPSVSGFGTVC
jgi:hypothetical protein